MLAGRISLRRRISLILVLLWPSLSFALGLGQINVHSALYQSFDAVIPLLSLQDVPTEDIHVSLANSDAYNKLGLELPTNAGKYFFAIQQQLDQQYAIHVTSVIPIRDPILTLLVEVLWPHGQIMRQYTIFLSPPEMAVAEQRMQQHHALSQPQSLTQAIAKPAEPVLPATGITYGPVVSEDHLWSIARQVKRELNASLAQVVVALFEKNNGAFVNDNMNVLRRGAVLRLPTATEIASVDQKQAGQLITLHNRNQQTPRPDHQSRVAAAPALAQQSVAPAQLVITGVDEPTFIAEAKVPDQPAVSLPAAAVPPAQPAVVTPVESQQPIAASLPTLSAPPSMRPSVEPKSAAPGLALPQAIQLEPGTQPIAETGTLDQSLSHAPQVKVQAVEQELAISVDALRTAQETNRMLSQRITELENQITALEEKLDDKVDDIKSLKKKYKRERSKRKKAEAALEAASVKSDAEAELAQSNTNDSVTRRQPRQQSPQQQSGASSLLWLLLGLLVVAGAIAGALFYVSQWALLDDLMARIQQWRRGEDAELEPDEEDDYAKYNAEYGQEVASTEQAEVAQADPESTIEIEASDTETEQEAAAEEPLPPASIDDSLDVKDALDDAEVYLTYKRYPEAEEILVAALAEFPASIELRMKLLGIYTTVENRQGFEDCLQALPEAEQDQARALWPEPEVTTVTNETIADTPADTVATQQAQVTESAEPAVGAPTSVVEPPASENSLDFQTGLGVGLSVAKAHSREDRLVEDAKAGAKLGESVDLSKILTDEPTADDQLSVDTSTESSALFGSDDPIATKLEMARSYLDMNKRDVAVELLEEIIKEGDDEQRRVAQTLLNKIRG